MKSEELMVSIDSLQKEIASKQKVVQELRDQMEVETVKNYRFLCKDGVEVSLLDLFGNFDELILIHNMGTSCAYCTMWADGFNAIYPQLEGKAAFVVTSPDTPETQSAFAAERGWTLPMFSTSNEGNTFRKDVGFQTDELVYPGLSVFIKQADRTITHNQRRIFGPGDNFGVLWHLLDLLPSSN